MYFLIVSSSTAPTLAQKYPLAHRCCPQYRFRSSGNSSCSFRDDRPFKYCTSFAGAIFDSHETSMWMWSGDTAPRMITAFLAWQICLSKSRGRGSLPCSASTPLVVPTTFQALYTSLDNYLASFNTTLNSQWNGVKYPVLFTANLYNANANSGPQIVNSGSVTTVLAQLQELKAMGVQAVTVEVGFPMLYEPFFSSHTQYQQFVTFYQNVAASVRAVGLKLIVENECLLNDSVVDGWNPAAFYATLNWTQYQAARAQTAVTIAQTMQPDYMVVLEEPDTEATMSGQTEVNTVSGSTSMLSEILSAMQTAGVSGIQVGAGVGTWLSQYQQFIQSFLTLPVNFIDMHVLTVNNNFLPNALTIASMAAAAGKPVTMTQTWLHKEADSELGVLSNDQILARDPFSFWAPLDAYFLQTMENMAYCTQMTFMDAFESLYFWAYLPYGTSTENLTPSQILNQEAQQAGQTCWPPALPARH
jgi:hypothetical protein